MSVPTLTAAQTISSSLLATVVTRFCAADSTVGITLLTTLAIIVPIVPSANCDLADRRRTAAARMFVPSSRQRPADRRSRPAGSRSRS